MKRDSGLAVTLSPELLDQLRREATAIGLPLEYLVASMVVDTMESAHTAHEPISTPSARKAKSRSKQASAA